MSRDHPLVGHVYDVAQRSEVSEAELIEALAGARFVLLGESHENADHHRLQGLILRQLAERGASPAVAFEMLRRDQQPALDQVLASPSPTPEAVRAAVGWDQSGWPDFAIYAPVFAAALDEGLPLVAADLSAEERAMLISSEPLPAQLRARLGVDDPLPADAQRRLERDLMESHCGQLPESELPRMVRVQRGRDATLARALLDSPEAADEDETGSAPPGLQAVLVAGAEHARRDRGAPRALAQLAPGADILSLAFLEVDPGEKDPFADLAARYGAEPVFDYVWFTPRASAEDPCERMKRSGRPSK